MWEIQEQDVGNSPATRVFGQPMKFYVKLMKHGEFIFHSTVVDEIWMKETSWQNALSLGRPRERPWKNMLLRKRSGEPSVSFTDTTQANERIRQCENDTSDTCDFDRTTRSK